MIGAFAHGLMRHPVGGWVVLALLTAASISGVLRLDYDDDLRNAFRAEQNFGSLRIPEDAFVCIVGGAAPLGGDVIGKLIEFDLELRRVPGIETVNSAFGSGGSAGVPFADGSLFPRDGARMPTTPVFASRKVAIQGHVVSEDGTTLLFVAEPNPKLRRVEDLAPIQREIEKLLSDLGRRTGLDVSISGVPSLRIRINETIRREHVLFSHGGFLIGTIVALLVFRRPAAVLIIFPVPVIATLWTLGGMGLAGEPVDALNTMASVLIPIIALTDSVHLTYAIRRYLAEGKTPPAAAAAGLSEVGAACFMTSFTTAISFASLMLSENQIVARFGATCAIATMFAFGAVVLLNPLLAASRLGRHLLSRNPVGYPSRFFEWNASFVSRFPRLIVAGAVAFSVTAVFACISLDVDFRYRENLDPSTPEWRAIERLEAKFGGSQPLTVLVSWADAPEWNGETLVNALRRVHAALSVPGSTGRPFSVLNLLESARSIDSRADFDQLVRDVAGNLGRGTIDLQERTALVTVPIKDEGAKILAPLLGEMDGRLLDIESEFPGLRLHLVGLTVASIRKSQPMIRELSASLFWSGLLIFGSVGLFIRSWTLGWASVIPNVMPLLAAGSWIHLQGHNILYASALSFCMCLGVAIDDTIHFLFRYKANRKNGATPLAAVRETLVTIGTSLATTTGILLSGFILLLTSELPTVRLCGSLGILTLSLALVGDLFVLPALLLARGHFADWETNSDFSSEGKSSSEIS